MIIMTTDYDKVVKKQLGIVSVSEVNSKNMFKDIGAGFKSIVGGKIGSYTKLLAETRERLLEEIEKKAEELGANAIVGLRIESSEIMPGMAEIMIYGTAVII